VNSNQINKIRKLGSQLGTVLNASNTYYNTFNPTVNILEPVVSTMLTYATSKKNQMPIAKGAVVPVATQHRRYIKGYHHHRVRKEDVTKATPKKIVKSYKKTGNPSRYVNTKTYTKAYGGRVETQYETDPNDTIVSLMNTYVTMYHSNVGTFRRTTTTTGTAIRSLGQTGFGPQNKTWIDTIYHQTMTDTNGSTFTQTQSDPPRSHNTQLTEKYNTSSFSPGKTIVPALGLLTNPNISTCTVLSCDTPNWKKAMDAPFFQTRNDPNSNGIMPWGDPAWKTAACKKIGTYTFFTSQNAMDHIPERILKLLPSIRRHDP
jgi:hypothetical protein